MTRGILLLALLIAACATPVTTLDSQSGEVPEPSTRPAALQSGEVAEHVIPGTEVGYAMVLVAGGEIELGSAPGAADRPENGLPPVTVELSPFWIGQHEVTFDEYRIFRSPDRDPPVTAAGQAFDVDAVARPSPPYEDPSAGLSGPGRPATGMTQWGALQYARWLSDKTGVFHRLPTEAEWEYACRLGGERDLEADAWYRGNSGERIQRVGTRLPDAIGLQDMLGNAAEWTLDEFREDYAVLVADKKDPWIQPTSLHPRTVRGGAFDDVAEDLRCGARTESTLAWKRRDPQIPKSFWWNTDSPFLGFRLVRPVKQPSADEAEAFWSTVLGN